MAAGTPELRRASSRVATLSSLEHPDPTELYEARRTLVAERIAFHVEKILRDAPPLTDEQRERVVTILSGGAA